MNSPTKTKSTKPTSSNCTPSNWEIIQTKKQTLGSAFFMAAVRCPLTAVRKREEPPSFGRGRARRAGVGRDEVPEGESAGTDSPEPTSTASRSPSFQRKEVKERKQKTHDAEVVSFFIGENQSVNSLISSWTVVMPLIFQALAPQKTRPWSTSPRTARMRAWVMQ